jgi:hypothetical protein
MQMGAAKIRIWSLPADDRHRSSMLDPVIAGKTADLHANRECATVAAVFYGFIHW